MAPKRKGVQWLCTLLLLGLPFLSIGGKSVLRLDAPTRTLLFFGAEIRIEEFFLFLIVLLILVFGFLLVTMLFGRVWCGWLCPQTTLADLQDWIDSRIDSLVWPKPVAVTLKHAGYLAISCLVACNLVWYFIAPADFFRRVSAGDIGAVAGISLLAIISVIYLDLALVRRSFCKTVCPYGRIQLMTMDPGTLTLEFDQKLKGACSRCGACVRACPMGIDIRKGLQIECINCGRCLDACPQGLIRYRFGSDGAEGSPVNVKAVATAAILALLMAALVFGVVTRREATLKVQRAQNAEARKLADGSLVNFFTVYVENRGTGEGIFSLQAAPLPGHRVELVGPVRDLRLPPNGNRRVNFAVKVSPAPQERRELELRLVKGEKVIAVSPLPLLTD